MTTVTIDATDLADLIYTATATADADDLPAELRSCWHHLATQAPDAALALLQLLEDDIADALTAVTT